MSIIRRVCFVVLGAAFGGCTGDDVTLGPDSGPPKTDATVDQFVASDASAEASAPRLLMTYAAATGELVGFDVNKGNVLGRLATPGFAIVEKSGGDYFALETGQDLVVRLDPASQWKPIASWNVAMNDADSGSFGSADPVQVIEVAANKAYVLRYDRNRIAIIDPSQSADAGAPTGSIDLSALVQAGDTDGSVEASGAVYDPASKRLYVTLSNIDLNNVIDNGVYQLCGTTVSTLIAIDTTTDTLVTLGDGGPGGAVALKGIAPQNGYLGGVVLDPVGRRVLVMSTGCNVLAGDGGVGALTGRVIEAVDLGTLTSTVLLDANAQQYPGVFTYIDGAHALVQFGFFSPVTYQWIPTQNALGPALPVTPDVFDFDYAGSRILGPQQTYATDGAVGPMNVIAVPISGDAGATILGTSPFLQTGGFEGNVVYIP
jgi:hypothetical protein